MSVKRILKVLQKHWIFLMQYNFWHFYLRWSDQANASLWINAWLTQWFCLRCSGRRVLPSLSSGCWEVRQSHRRHLSGARAPPDLSGSEPCKICGAVIMMFSISNVCFCDIIRLIAGSDPLVSSQTMGVPVRAMKRAQINIHLERVSGFPWVMPSCLIYLIGLFW